MSPEAAARAGQMARYGSCPRVAGERAMAEGAAQATKQTGDGAGQARTARHAPPRPAVPRRLFSQPGEAAERSAGARSGRGQSGVSPAPSRSPRQREDRLPAIAAHGTAPPIVHDVLDSP